MQLTTAEDHRRTGAHYQLQGLDMTGPLPKLQS